MQQKIKQYFSEFYRLFSEICSIIFEMWYSFPICSVGTPALRGPRREPACLPMKRATYFSDDDEDKHDEAFFENFGLNYFQVAGICFLF